MSWISVAHCLTPISQSIQAGVIHLHLIKRREDGPCTTKAIRQRLLLSLQPQQVTAQWRTVIRWRFCPRDIHRQETEDPGDWRREVRIVPGVSPDSHGTDFTVFQKGDQIINVDPDPGEPAGWICVNAGEFGTTSAPVFKPMFEIGQ